MNLVQSQEKKCEEESKEEKLQTKITPSLPYYCNNLQDKLLFF
jgi:hypothetical protein